MPQCAVVTCGNNYRKASNVRYHRFPSEDYIREHWKAICGRKDPAYNCQTARVCSLHFSRENYEKDLEHELLGLPPRTRLRRGAYPDIDVPVLMPNLKKIMKQITSIKKKLNTKKSDVKQQNGHQNVLKRSHINKRVLNVKRKTGSQAKNSLNVNERPVRKKKKTKKYETYERNRKSPTPEVRQETNLLLALGLTPVKKDLNRMHIMEEENGKASADAAQLPETPADLPKKALAVITKVETTQDAPPSSPKVNGIASEIKEEVMDDDPPAVDIVEKTEPDETKEGVEVIRVPSTSGTVDIKEEPDARVETAEEKNSEPQDLTVTCTSTFESLPKTSQSERHYPNNKVISISVEQCQTNHNSVSSIPAREEDGEKIKKPKQITNRKRSNKSTDSDESLKANYKRKHPDIDHVNDDRERTVSEYVEKASGSSLEELQRNTEKLQQEIHSLSALARAKELEWNDIIRLKKVKEEMYLRLIRRKQVMLLSMGATSRLSDASTWDFSSENRMTDFFTNDEVSYNRVGPSISPKPPPRIPSNLTITKSQSNPSQNIQRFLMQPHGSSDSKPSASLMMVPIVSSTPLSISSTSSYLPRPHSLTTPLKIPIPDRDKFKNANNRNIPVPILPKPNQTVNVNEHSPPIGRQGPIVDVKSIIADYRQNHPEQIPRRGRRLKGTPSHSQGFSDNIVTSSRGVLSMSSLALGSGSQVRTVGSTSGNDLSYLIGGMGQSSQETSRPSSTDSNRSTSAAQNDVTASGVSFKDVLVQFAKMSQHQQNDRRNSTPPTKAQTSAKTAALYPEVTLHPVLPAGSQSPPNPSSSLLHGILTKNSRNDGQSTSRNTTFSPTLARLLTTPDKPASISTTITTALRGSTTTTTTARAGTGPVSISDLLSTSKNRNELTITPVVSALQPAKLKEETANASEEDPEDSADRLVIDESEEQDNRVEDEDMDGESVPECQGCHMKSAQFVCAGCGNQWYCSRNCQVTAWDEHSEVCSG